MRTRRVVRWIAVLVVAASLATAVRVLVVVASAPTGDDEVTAQVRWLEDAVAGGADDRMQAWFPEGRLFVHVLAGQAGAALLAEDPASAPATLDEVRAHLVAVDADGPRFGTGMAPDHGIFHAAWGLALAVDVATVSDAPTDRRDVAARADAVAAALSGPDGPFPASYPGRHWPVDAVVAAASLARADELLADRDWRDVLAAWRTDALALADPDLGLLPHEVGPDGRPLDGPRGSSQAMVQAFWPDVALAVDGRLDETSWTTFLRTFVVRRAGVVGVREFPGGVDGRGDVDSGPLVAGVSASASAVTLAAARRNGDVDLARALDAEAELFGIPVEWSGRRRFALGVAPVGDAFVAWARTRPAGPLSTLSGPLHPSPRWWLVLALALLPGLVGGATWWWARPRGLPTSGLAGTVSPPGGPTRPAR